MTGPLFAFLPQCRRLNDHLLFGPQDLSRCKNVMIERGELFLKKISLSREKVAKLCHTFIKDGAVRVVVKLKCINEITHF